jgi:hypothetical protein
MLQTKIESALNAGGLPFEVIVGVPACRYGARVTLYPAADAARLALAFGLERHPWGVPSWIGIRVMPTGEAKVKPYHRLTRVDDRFLLPTELPADLYPVAAALDGATKEIYLRRRAPISWDHFVSAAVAPLGHRDFVFQPYPRSALDGFGLSLRWTGDRLDAISLYAFSRALSDDQAIQRQWTQGMSEIDLRAYEMAVVGARSLGRLRRGKRHSILAWTLEQNGEFHRAVSLRIVPPEQQLRHAFDRQPVQSGPVSTRR